MWRWWRTVGGAGRRALSTPATAGTTAAPAGALRAAKATALETTGPSLHVEPMRGEPAATAGAVGAAGEVRLIDETGTNVGIMTTAEAQRRAAERGLKLVEVNTRAVPPVCRLVDRAWGAKATAEPGAAPAPTTSSSVARSVADAGAQRPRAAPPASTNDSSSSAEADRKEIRMRAKISAHDLDVKINKLSAFLAKGNRVKITLQYRPEETPPPELAAMLKAVTERLADYGSVERDARPEGRRALALLMAPSKTKMARAAAAATGTKPAPEPVPAASKAGGKPTAAGQRPVASPSSTPRASPSSTPRPAPRPPAGPAPLNPV